MTINKSQGQSIQGRLGIFLPSPVFAHGQLYVAFSRGVSFSNVRVLVENNDDEKQRTIAPPLAECATKQFTVNVVDQELLSAAHSINTLASSEHTPLPCLTNTSSDSNSAEKTWYQERAKDNSDMYSEWPATFESKL
eukprot:5852411-Karenia_brevis.AAC.1